jgi:hypothetical protein
VIRLDKVLKDYKIDLQPEQFKEVVVGVAQQLAPGWTDERITCNPRVALSLCTEVRQRVNNEALPDEPILRALTNIRRRIAS